MTTNNKKYAIFLVTAVAAIGGLFASYMTADAEETSYKEIAQTNIDRYEQDIFPRQQELKEEILDLARDGHAEDSPEVQVLVNVDEYAPLGDHDVAIKQIINGDIFLEFLTVSIID